MTTIAYRDGILAADSLASGPRGRCGSVQKIATNKSGVLAGAGGRVADLSAFIKWIESGDTEGAPQTADDFDGLLVNPDGAVFLVSQDCRLSPITGRFMAVGSGEAHAMGAMAMGATAVEAVRVAIEFDVYSGGEVHLLELEA